VQFQNKKRYDAEVDVDQVEDYSARQEQNNRDLLDILRRDLLARRCKVIEEE